VAVLLRIKKLEATERGRFQPRRPTVNGEFVTSFAKAIMLLPSFLRRSRDIRVFSGTFLTRLSLSFSVFLPADHLRACPPPRQSRTVGFYIFELLARKIALTFKPKDPAASGSALLSSRLKVDPRDGLIPTGDPVAVSTAIVYS